MLGSSLSILTRSASVLAVRIAQIGFGALVAIILARYLGPSEYGKYVFIVTLVVFLSVPIQTGLSEFIVRETAKSLAAGTPEHIYRLWRWSISITLQITFATTFVLVILLYVLKYSGKIDTTPMLLSAILLLCLIAIQNGFTAALRGLGRVVQSQLIDGILRHILFLTVIGIAIFMLNGRVLTSKSTLILQVISMGILITLVVPVFVRRSFRKIWSAEYSLEKKTWLRAMIPFTLIGGVNIINQSTDIFMLGIFAPTSEVAVYRVGSVLAGFVALGLGAIQTVMAPKITNLFASGNIAEIRFLSVRSAQAALVLTVIIFLTFLIYGDALIRYTFGPEYSGAYQTLVILAFAQLFNSAMGMNSTLLSMTDNESIVLRILLFAALINIVLNAILIQFLGSLGAAIATAITIFMWNISMNIRCVKIFGFQFSAFSQSR